MPGPLRPFKYPHRRYCGRMPLYALRPGRSWRENYAALYIASLYKGDLKGVYYIPSLRLYAPVFEVKELPPAHEWAFMEVRVSQLNRAYRMVCMECGACCARNSGAFAFAHELTAEERASLEPEVIRAPRVGDILLYWLDRGPAGRCVFFDERGKCVLGDRKPVACLVYYCSLFAERGGKLYVKVAVRRDGTPVYRAASRTEAKRLARRLRARALAFVRRRGEQDKPPGEG